MDDDYLGVIKIFAGNFAPRNWAFCNGQLLPISSNSALFSILGTIYGGDGRTTFALPDLRGRVPVNSGSSRGGSAGPGLSPYGLGERIGTEYNVLTQSQLPSHTHSASGRTQPGQVSLESKLAVSSAEADSHTPTEGVSLAAGNVSSGSRGATNPAQIYNNATPDITLSGASSTASIPAMDVQVTVNPAGGSQSVNNLQPSLGINYIICLQGMFPSRS